LYQPASLFSKGFAINILPIVSIVIMVMQQRMTAPKMSGEGSEQQKIMLFMLPIMMLLFLYNATSGLNLYVMINMIFMMFQTGFKKKNEIKIEH
jgi:membrane protein insertase Oxa1/YidC/SpoIIIJ